eukprot:m.26987 g.26987  ORF g.26987 m.26987 type:complete len:52 (+) comp29627_c0_seq1:1024-1179(+)
MLINGHWQTTTYFQDFFHELSHFIKGRPLLWILMPTSVDNSTIKRRKLLHI